LALRAAIKLQSLRFRVLGDEFDETENLPLFKFEVLAHIYGLRSLDVECIPSLLINFPSLLRGLKKNSTLEALNWRSTETDLRTRKKIEFYLERNRWFNKYGSQVLGLPQTIALEVWPRLLARVSSNATTLFSLVKCYPGLVERACNSFPKRLHPTKLRPSVSNAVVRFADVAPKEQKNS